MSIYLIVGLGNPGFLYKNTRHNYGFKVVKALAKKHKLEFKKDSSFLGKIAKGNIEGKKTILLLPQTYMNESGKSVQKVFNFYKIDLKNILIVADDADITFGEFKIKTNSSAGGHNGLASIEKYLNTNSYARLRLGIGKSENKLESYVLDSFTSDEKQLLSGYENKATGFIELWLKSGIEIAANTINAKSEEVKNNNEEKDEK